MPWMHIKSIAIVVLALGMETAWARDGMRITLPRRSDLTPVQRLNREGVEAIKKHQYEKAGALFYKAYLYDPADPFTLNNLGYISELQGQLDRARRFYELAVKQGSTAEIDLSSAKDLEGRPMMAALQGHQDLPMQVNRINMQAMRLLSENRGFEAVAVLKTALPLDPRSPFTLNNLGVAHETIGDYQNALMYYGQAADQHSSEPVVVTQQEDWRGRPVSQMAADSARRLQRRIDNMDPAEARSLTYTMHGVSAANQNDWATARQNFLKAYSLNPRGAFALNNRGYVAEQDGDLETAQFFYQKARRADDAGARVGLATQQSAEGSSLNTVASDSNQKVDDALERYSEQRRREKGPIELTPRGPGASQEGPSSNPPPSPSVPH